ncbi:MAG: hypothetical protein ACYTGG_09220, partial [Planctomycetota bacterium]
LDLFVLNVSLQFNNPLDRGYAVAGSPDVPLDIHLDGPGIFYENAFGTERPPNAALIPFFPSLAFDTFVTINTKSTADGDSPSLSPGFPSGPTALADGLSGTNLGWFVTPDNPVALPDAGGRVLVMQLSVDLATNPQVTGMGGTFLTQWDDASGETFQYSCWFDSWGGGCAPIPAPGALAVLAVAGLRTTRRRRRA